MFKVEVFKTIGDGQELFFSITYNEDNNVVEMLGVPSKLMETWEEFGIPVRPGKVFKPEDGLDFLKAVSRDFNGSMTRSNDVKEEV